MPTNNNSTNYCAVVKRTKLNEIRTTPAALQLVRNYVTKQQK